MRSEGEAERPGGESGKRGGRIDSRGAPASARQATRSAHSGRSSPRNRHHTLRLGCALCNNLAVVASTLRSMVSILFYTIHLLFLLTLHS